MGDLALRQLLGVCSATVVSFPAHQALPLACSSALLGSLLTTAVLHAPCSSIVETSLLQLGLLGLTLTSLCFQGYIAGVLGVSVCTGLVLLSVCLVAPLLLLYGVFRLFLLTCAVTCPPAGGREDAEGSNDCNVDLVLRGPSDAWLLLTPAVCHVPVSDVLLYVTPDATGSHAKTCVSEQYISGLRPRLEFPVLDYLSVKHKLEAPLVVLFGPLAGGHSHEAENIYSDEDPRAIATLFIRRIMGGGGAAEEASQQVLSIIHQRSKVGQILAVSIVVILPPEWRHHDSDGESGDETEMLLYSMRSRGRTEGSDL